MPPVREGLEGSEAFEARKKDLDEYGEALKARESAISELSEAIAERDISGVVSKTWLLGIDWGHLPVWDDVYDSKGTIGRMRVSTGVAGVVPAWKITDLLEERGIQMARDNTEKQLSEKDEGAVVPDASEAGEFAQFEDLTRRLVQVPKRDLDEKRKEP